MLTEHIEKGNITIDTREQIYIGHTPTGEVQIGEIGNEEELECYLENYPNPTDW